MSKTETQTQDRITQLEEKLAKTSKAINLVMLMTEKVYNDKKHILEGRGIKVVTHKSVIGNVQILPPDKIVRSKYSKEFDEIVREEARKKEGITIKDVNKILKRAKNKNDYLNYLYVRALRYMMAENLKEVEETEA